MCPSADKTLYDRHYPLCAFEDCNTRSFRRGYCKKHLNRLKAEGVLKPINYRDFRDSFWARVEKGENPDDCWKWNGAKTVDGYGRINVKGKKTSASRLSYFIHHGHWPKDYALHHCDNPECANPKHIYDGTPKQNAADMVNRGRASQLNNLPNYHVTMSQKLLTISTEKRQQVREALRTSCFRSVIADKYDVPFKLVAYMHKYRPTDLVIAAVLGIPPKEFRRHGFARIIPVT